MSDLDYILEKVFLLPKMSPFKQYLASKNINTATDMADHYRNDLHQVEITMRELETTYNEGWITVMALHKMLINISFIKEHERPSDWKNVTQVSLAAFMCARSPFISPCHDNYPHSDRRHSFTAATASNSIDYNSDGETTVLSAPSKLETSISPETNSTPPGTHETPPRTQNLIDFSSGAKASGRIGGAQDPIGNLILRFETPRAATMARPTTPAARYLRKSGLFVMKTPKTLPTRGSSSESDGPAFSNTRRRLFDDTDDRINKNPSIKLSDRHSKSPKDVVITDSNQANRWEDDILTDDEAIQDEPGTETILFEYPNRTKDSLPFGSPKPIRMQAQGRVKRPPTRYKPSPLAPPARLGGLVGYSDETPGVFSISRQCEKLQIDSRDSSIPKHGVATSLLTPQVKKTGSMERRASSLWTCTQNCFSPTGGISGLFGPLTSFGGNTPHDPPPKPTGSQEIQSEDDKRPQKATYSIHRATTHTVNHQEHEGNRLNWTSPQNPLEIFDGSTEDSSVKHKQVLKAHTPEGLLATNRSGMLLQNSFPSNGDHQPVLTEQELEKMAKATMESTIPISGTPEDPSNMDVGPSSATRSIEQGPRPKQHLLTGFFGRPNSHWGMYAMDLDNMQIGAKKIFDVTGHPDDLAACNYSVPFESGPTPALNPQFPQLTTWSPDPGEPHKRHLPSIGARYDPLNGERKDDTGTTENFKNFRVFSSTDPVGALISVPRAIPSIQGLTVQQKQCVKVATPVTHHDTSPTGSNQNHEDLMMVDSSESDSDDEDSIDTNLIPYEQPLELMTGTQQYLSILLRYNNQVISDSLKRTPKQHFQSVKRQLKIHARRYPTYNDKARRVPLPYTDDGSDEDSIITFTGPSLRPEPTVDSVELATNRMKRRALDLESQHAQKKPCSGKNHTATVPFEGINKNNCVSPGTPLLEGISTQTPPLTHKPTSGFPEDDDDPHENMSTGSTVHSSTDPSKGAEMLFDCESKGTAKTTSIHSLISGDDTMGSQRTISIGDYTSPQLSMRHREVDAAVAMVWLTKEPQHALAVTGNKHQVSQLHASGHLDGDNGSHP